MLIVLHPTYTLRLEIQDRLADGPQYFNGVTGKSGCDEVLNAVKAALIQAGIKNASVYLEKFEHKG